MKISAIIPVYNSEKYLKKCIDSIINQSIGFENVEIILVDDGSIDDSKKIIKDYLKKYKNIKYFYQKNSGQGSARNKGLSMATGEYISFIDSDDWIDSNMFLDLYNVANRGNKDIVTCDYKFIIENVAKPNSSIFIDDINKNFIITKTGPCNMIINRKFILNRGFCFPEGIIYEDIASIPILGINSKLSHINKPYYNYLQRTNSTMNIKKYNIKLENIFEALNMLYNSFKKKKKLSKYKAEIEYIYIRRLLMSASLRFISYNDPNDCIKRISSEMKEKFPNWKNNKYYKKLPFNQKIVAKLSYRNKKRILKILYKLKNWRNKL